MMGDYQQILASWGRVVLELAALYVAFHLGVKMQTNKQLEALLGSGVGVKDDYSKAEVTKLVLATRAAQQHIANQKPGQPVQQFAGPVPEWMECVNAVFVTRMRGKGRNRKPSYKPKPWEPNLLGSGGDADAYEGKHDGEVSAMKAMAIGGTTIEEVQIEFERYVKETRITKRAASSFPEFVVGVKDTWSFPPTAAEEVESAAQRLLDQFQTPSKNKVATSDSPDSQGATSDSDSPRSTVSDSSFSNKKNSFKAFVCMVLEKCGEGSLRERLEKICGDGEHPLTVLSTLLPFISYVAEGVHRLNSIGIEHGDLSYENVLFAARGDDIVPVIADFGLANTEAANDVRGLGYIVFDICNELLSKDDDNGAEYSVWEVLKYELQFKTHDRNSLPDWSQLMRAKSAWFDGFEQILSLILKSTGSDNKELMTVSDFKCSIDEVVASLDQHMRQGHVQQV